MRRISESNGILVVSWVNDRITTHAITNNACRISFPKFSILPVKTIARIWVIEKMLPEMIDRLVKANSYNERNNIKRIR